MHCLDERQIAFSRMQEEIVCGISYCNYGVPPQIVIDKADRIWIGFGEKLTILDEKTRDIVLEKQLFSVLYEIVSDKSQKYMCVFCELDVYCFYEGRLIWEYGFPDIVCGFQIADDQIAEIKYGTDGEKEVRYYLHNGRPVMPKSD